MEAADLLARCTFPSPGTTVDCAVSGGPDSLALLVLAVEAGLMVTAWHVDHGLRPGSDAEGERVAVVADSLGAAAVSVTAMVGDGPNLEARAREARLDALPDGVLTGHTADDQAETVLLNLLRGSGIHGSAGIGDPGRRPLLGLRRSETRAFCVACGLEPLDDPMNVDPRFVRNRIRNEVLPLLAEVSDRDPVPLLARHAGLAGEAVVLLDALIADIDPTDARTLAVLSPELARLALRGWLTGLLGGRPPDAAAIDRVFDVAGGLVRATEVAGGLRIERSRGRLRPLPEGGHIDGCR
ncbi:MAG: tRNA lysidine(34) synthetase TilS [Actinomycetota bacterium]|nr:tRNA lysidine(34) synthetase TilS [Actinomycetota bacterium]